MSMDHLVRIVEKDYMKKEIPEIRPGDTVKLHLKVKEGGRERTQVFQGIVISLRGSGISRTITVRRIASGGIGVERIVPLHSPALEKIEVVRKGKVRRAKLYYLRNIKGKIKIKERR
jgi:large subunit ribosomal protein L19